jgi:pimeloyl-ACP methyl ester carboxylesterase
MDLLDIGVLGWPSVHTEFNNGVLSLSFPSDSGLQVIQLNQNDEDLTGTWTDPRFEEESRVSLTLQHEQNLISEQRVKINGPVGQIGASLILPRGEGPFPGVVFLHGSGPQPRDASRFAALSLASFGIAGIFFDKRGVGESEGSLDQVKFEDLALDGVKVGQYLQEHPKVNKVGFWGHSQGGWIAPLAATLLPEAAFVITSAGPAVPPSREGQWDVVRRVRQAGYDVGVERHCREIIKLWHDGVREGRWQPFDEAIKVARGLNWFDTADLSVFITRPSKDFSDNYRVTMDHDPKPILKALKVPMLALFALKDESIDSLESIDILAALGNEGLSATIITYPHYDHSMRKVGSEGRPLRFGGHPKDYFALQAGFIHSVLD